MHTLQKETCRRPQTAVWRSSDTLRSEGGQSLLLALMVMFLMVFIGGMFIGIVGRNILRAQRSGEVIGVQYLAEAGIRYADHQLTYSEDGADWRPVPDYPELVRHLEDPTNFPMPASNLLPDEDDPDHSWLMQGYSRYHYGKGRFLLKVSYEPRPDDPMSKFIKIESVGRMGVVDPEDPTVFQKRQPVKLRKELVAYKPIAITDYARFITNRDRKPEAATLGTPNFITQFGALLDDGQGNKSIYGAPIRVNGDLVWHGRNIIWLDPARGQGVEVAGDIRHEDAKGGPDTLDTEVFVNADIFGNSYNGAAVESDKVQFSTTPGLADPPVDVTDPEIGWYRDGSAMQDVSARPRGITRLDPPNLDSIGVSGRLSRYRELTRNSGEWRLDSRGDWYNTGYYGWGEGIYVDNVRDVQTESVGYTMRADWTQPGSSQFWHGPYYDPPGITVVILPYDVNDNDPNHGPADGPDIIITRDERDRYIWRDKDGNVLPETGEQIVMPYPKNGVLFAEGNIRIKGTLAPGKQLTVVSGGTIYIDGSILKYRDPNNPGVIGEDCSIALLAADYVCVNTTQFFGPLKEVPFPGPGSGFFDVSSTSSFWFNFAFGDDVARYTRGGKAVPVELFVRHSAAPGGAAYMNMLVNWPSSSPAAANNPYYSFYEFALPGWANTPSRQFIYPLGDPQAWPGRYGSQQYESWEHQVFGLSQGAGVGYDLNLVPGSENRIGFQLDQSTNQPSAPQDYYISRAAVQPMDVQIEAIIYAQNKSFFVIPGEWFNPDPDDLQSNPPDAPNMQRRAADPSIDPRWPFYGQPLDVRITIRGAVSENMPASVGDTSAWMEKWGWIPMEHGNSGEVTGEYRPSLDPGSADFGKRLGLTIIYDGLLSHPVRSGSLIPLRVDEYGRPLPIAPKLPVSPQTIYMGKPS